VIAGKLFVSADYCQLELRVLAHLAKDCVLCSVLKSSCDVFRTIAATWHQVAESDVSNSYFYQITWHYISGNFSFGIPFSSAINIHNISAKIKCREAVVTLFECLIYCPSIPLEALQKPQTAKESQCPG